MIMIITNKKIIFFHVVADPCNVPWYQVLILLAITIYVSDMQSKSKRDSYK